jgi:hypothetical protein
MFVCFLSPPPISGKEDKSEDLDLVINFNLNIYALQFTNNHTMAEFYITVLLTARKMYMFYYNCLQIHMKVQFL